MSIIQESSVLDQVEPSPGKRFSYRSAEELKIREMVESWGREKWPGYRCVHELTVGRGNARCDIAFIGVDHFVTVEIKSSYDTTERLLHQVAMFRLVSPETWLVIHSHYRDDMGLAQYLFPSVGTVTVQGSDNSWDKKPYGIVAETPAAPFVHHKRAMLSILWAAELGAECKRIGVVGSGKIPTCKVMLDKLCAALSVEEATSAVCRQLRGRDAVWRADPPIYEAAPQGIVTEVAA